MLSKLYDNRVECVSILLEMKVADYLSLVEKVYRSSGGIEGQRAPLKTKTAITIRSRMVADLRGGAVIPPVVVGVLLDQHEYQEVDRHLDPEHFLAFIQGRDANQVSVIDGMQRTTAMLEAVAGDNSVSERRIRVEFWIAQKISSLIYRMLVLNTGQVPWDIGRQLETVYGQFLAQIRKELGNEVEILLLSDERRRAQAGQYQSRNIIELLLLFSSRKSELDFKDKVAEDFARLDAIETSSHSEFIDFFIHSLRLMSDLDREFSRLDLPQPNNSRIRTGKDIFSSFPAMAGFMSAIAVSIFDEPGFTIDWDKARNDMRDISHAVEELIGRLRELDKEALQDFMELGLLEQRLSQRSGQVGRFERELFRKAFASMFRNAARLPSLQPCWMA